MIFIVLKFFHTSPLCFYFSGIHKQSVFLPSKAAISQVLSEDFIERGKNRTTWLLPSPSGSASLPSIHPMTSHREERHEEKMPVVLPVTMKTLRKMTSEKKGLFWLTDLRESVHHWQDAAAKKSTSHQCSRGGKKESLCSPDFSFSLLIPRGTVRWCHLHLGQTLMMPLRQSSLGTPSVITPKV